MKTKWANIMGMALLSMTIVMMTACGSDTSSATQQVKEFRDYIEVQDEEGLFENAIAEEDTYWTEAQAHDVVQMLKNDEDENAEMMGIMAAQGQHYDATSDKNTEYDLYDDVTKVGPFYIDEEDDEFVLRVRSYDVTIVTEPNAVVTFLDDEYTANEDGEIEVGKIGPGFYEMEGTLETEDGEETASDDFFMFEYEEFSPTVYLGFE